jgi:hypothetical protein
MVAVDCPRSFTAPQAVLEMVPRRRGFDVFWTAAFARGWLKSRMAVPLS